MCARRFLMVMFFLTLLAVAAAFAIFQFGDRVLIRERRCPRAISRRPQGRRRPGLCASGRTGWRGPDLANDPSEWLPDGVQQRRTGDAAIFYIHPTTYLERDRWNAPLQPGGETEFRTQLFVQSQASAFNGAATGLGAALSPGGLRRLPARTARTPTRRSTSPMRDVAAAFDQFLERKAGDRPIILAGHSQGALHLERLLKREGRGQADRQADGRGLCRRLADQHRRRPARRSACPPCTTPDADRLHPVVDELRRARQSRPHPR